MKLFNFIVDMTLTQVFSN